MPLNKKVGGGKSPCQESVTYLDWSLLTQYAPLLLMRKEGGGISALNV